MIKYAVLLPAPTLALAKSFGSLQLQLWLRKTAFYLQVHSLIQADEEPLSLSLSPETRQLVANRTLAANCKVAVKSTAMGYDRKK
jgi:hypothetical protein